MEISKEIAEPTSSISPPTSQDYNIMKMIASHGSNLSALRSPRAGMRAGRPHRRQTRTTAVQISIFLILVLLPFTKKDNHIANELRTRSATSRAYPSALCLPIFFGFPRSRIPSLSLPPYLLLSILPISALAWFKLDERGREGGGGIIVNACKSYKQQNVLIYAPPI